MFSLSTEVRENETSFDDSSSSILEDNIRSEDEKTFSFEEKSLIVKSGQKFNYFLYTPKKVKDDSSLILYLHGGSGKPNDEDDDLSLLIADDGLPKFVKDKQIEPNSYIVFPQLPYGKKRLE